MSWADIQQNTFTRWLNDYLKVRGMTITDLKKDFKDGVLLVNLMEIISGKSLGRYNKHPKISYQKLENLQIALDFIKGEGIKLVNIGAGDLADGNLRLILGLVWTLIIRYEIKGGHDNEKNAIDDLLKWVQSKIPEYNITGFTQDWNDGRAVCGLVDALRPGLIPNHRSMDPANRLQNATTGINTAFARMGVDPLILPEEMTHPKVDKLAMMTYIAQFRNLPEKTSDASRVSAYGPGLVEGILNQPAKFNIHVPKDVEGKVEVKVNGPSHEAKVDLSANVNGLHTVSYTPTETGNFIVAVTLDGQHVPGSLFHPHVLAAESLGGEGKIRVYYSTTSASEKYKHDKISLENLLRAKKVHLRPDFEPWIPVDVMEKEDREIVFRKAGTRTLPIVFVDDKYIGDYDTLNALNEEEKLDAVLAVDKNTNLISEAEHMARLKSTPSDVRERNPLSPRGNAQ